jgi:hypothetical protein
MSKYVNVQRDIEGVFATSAWTSNSISAYPANFAIPANIAEFVKIEVLPLKSNIDYGRFGISGLAIIQVYVPANKGTTRILQISDLLDTVLQNKTLGNGTQTQESLVQILGQDPETPNLFRGDYQVHFNLYN